MATIVTGALTKGDIDRIAKGAMDALTNVASRPNDLSPLAVEDNAHAIKQEMVNEVTAVVKHVTNNEPWYQSRVTLGAITVAVPSALSLVFMLSNGVFDVEALTTPIVSLIGAGITIYGRWVATKPLVLFS